jgi:cyclase
LDTIKAILRAGADKVSLNSAAVRHPDLVNQASERFGRQCIVVAIDARRVGERWTVWVRGGRQDTGKDAIAWAEEVVERGAGELLVTSMDADGTKAGYDLDLIQTIAQRVSVPVIASGGAGTCEHIGEVLTQGQAGAALLASLLHYGEVTVSQIKQYLTDRGIPVRHTPG